MTPLEKRKAELRAHKEKWRPIPRYPGYYASNQGRIKGPSKLLVPYFAKGYPRVSFSINKKCYNFAVHRLVLEAFVGPRPPGKQCGHLDGNPANSHLGNLKWVTPKENANHRLLHGTQPMGEKHPMAKITDALALEIRSRFVRRNAHKSNLMQLVKEYGFSQGAIQRIVSGNGWKHLPPPPLKRFPRLVNQCVRIEAHILKKMKKNGLSVSDICRQACADALARIAGNPT